MMRASWKYGKYSLGGITTYYFVAPYWILFLVASAIASVAWLTSRFSLRTLLIATTLVAAGLGLFVWLGR